MNRGSDSGDRVLLKIGFAVLLSILLLSLPVFTQASQMKVLDLSDICTARDSESASACRFYILGVTEGASVGEAFCIPEGVSSRDMVLTVKEAMAKDLAAFPQDKDMPAVSFVVAVMMKSYPCKK